MAARRRILILRLGPRHKDGRAVDADVTVCRVCMSYLAMPTSDRSIARAGMFSRAAPGSRSVSWCERRPAAGHVP
jgi:hypothetical protein